MPVNSKYASKLKLLRKATEDIQNDQVEGGMSVVSSSLMQWIAALILF